MHDVLAAVLFGEFSEVPVTFNDRWTEWTERAMRASLDALCWVLQHRHNPAFAQDMARLEADIRAAGYNPVQEVAQ